MINLNLIKSILSSWLILIVFLQMTLSIKFEYRINKFISFILASTIISVVYYNLHFTEINISMELYILSTLILILYNIIFKGELLQKSLICIVLLQFFLISRIWIYITYYVLYFFNGDFENLKYITHFIVNNPFLSRNILFIILSLYLYLYINSDNIRFEYLCNDHKLLYTCITFSFINYNLLLYFFLELTKYDSKSMLILVIIYVSALSFIFLSLIILVLKMLSEKSHIQSALNIIEHQLSIQLNHYNKLEDYVTKSRMVVHDTKHHILALDMLLKNNQFEEAKTYIEHLEDDLFILERSKVCDNKIVDAVIQYTILDCDKKSIHLDHNIKIPEGISIDNFDLAVIFGNLLNNAVESCQCIERNSMRKYITITGDIINNNLVVKIINSNTKKVVYSNKGLLKTTKRNKQNHGIGIISVKNSINKYNGNINFKSESNRFLVNFSIPLIH